jgi:outer membrane protein OmpA-like peptidoglycan-associated protein
MDQEQKANGKSGAYAELRKLLLPEGEDLSRLHVRISNPQLRADDVSEVLPTALEIGAARGPELRSALRPLVEEALRISVQKDPALLANALFPIVGQAVRKAVLSVFRRVAHSLDRAFERTLTWRSLRWRRESLRTGQSYPDLVLAHSALYRVEQVFLIHRDTGLLLDQCGAESGLLMEIQDYLRDSCGAQNRNALEILPLGNFDVWVQHGSHAILGAVLRGAPPRQLKTRLQQTLEHIHAAKAAELENFDGDPSPFLSCEEDLRGCLLGEATETPRRISPLWWLAAAILLELVGYSGFTGWRDQRRWEDYLARLREQPGIVVTTARRHDSSYFVAGLRDPLALDPATLIEGTGLDPKSVTSHWELYHSLQPAFEAARRVTNETQTIENQTLHFAPASADISEEDIATIDQIARHMRTLTPLGKTIEVIGHTDGTKLEEQQHQLGQTRAEAVRNALIDAGVPQNALLARAAGPSQPLRTGNSDTDKLFNRYVSFRVR